MTSTISPPAPASATGISAEQAQQRMQVLFSVALRNSVAALDGFTRRLGSALAAASVQAEHEANADAAHALKQAAEHLSRERTSFQRLFSDCLQHAFEQESNTLFARRKSRLRNDALDLSLKSFDAMERKVAIDNIAQAHDRANAGLLALLQARIANWIGREAAGLRNPFRAEVFLHAALEAWDRFEPGAVACAALQQQLAPGSFLPLDAILSALDQELAARDVQASSELQYRHHQQQEGASMLGLLHAERRLLGRGAAVFDKALAVLAQTGTLPAYTLALLRVLQPPLRTLAQADTRFLLNARHPARRLLQLCIHASLACGGKTAEGQALLDTVEEIAARLQRQRSSSILEEACAAVDAHLAPRLEGTATRRDECIDQAMQQEREARAEQQARSEVMARLEDGTAPPFVERFLLEQWVRVLSFARNVHASKPALLPNLVQAMDDLIWSVAPKPDAAAIADLEQRRPALLALLNAWLNVVKWEGPARARFFADLEERHALLALGEAARDAREQLQDRLDVTQRASDIALERRASKVEEEALLPYMHRIDALVPGDWAEFVRNDGSTLQCRLSWTSNARSRFVLVAPTAQTAFIITEQLFAESLRAGRTRITATGEVMQSPLAIACDEAGQATG